MGIKVARKHLQTDIYDYIWVRDKGDGEYTGIRDKIKIDKDEGYEVLYFVQTFMNKHGLKTTGDVHRIEDALQNHKLSSVVMRDKLIAEIEKMLGFCNYSPHWVKFI